MYAARHVDNIDLIVMYPHNRISELQELMMTTIEDKHLHVYGGGLLFIYYDFAEMFLCHILLQLMEALMRLMWML